MVAGKNPAATGVTGEVNGSRHRVLLFVLLVLCAVWCGPVEAVKKLKHGDQGLGQHLAKDAKRKETALPLAPFEGQTGQCGATIRNGG
ncbi:hypothetical protein RKD54_000382 [Pseudarthrobacter sp. SLBN-100]|uniref:hypothetical protein n=1 Tax=Arthrobacter sp. SLBN-100 TaxID=2768450 RepID=UPI0011537471|nr:hypothetical protein [Arthrobacter sp. SLBN-100]